MIHNEGAKIFSVLSVNTRCSQCKKRIVRNFPKNLIPMVLIERAMKKIEAKCQPMNFQLNFSKYVLHFNLMKLAIS